MTELVAKISNIVTNNVIHMNFAYFWSNAIEEQCNKNLFFLYLMSFNTCIRTFGIFSNMKQLQQKQKKNLAAT